ncbi:MAG TPA: CHAT domain-containing protein [Candidatus Acidoferrales bacterium]|nr:CHAT domain-containing protein [Candidatus Acidoferrales bacterium]
MRLAKCAALFVLIASGLSAAGNSSATTALRKADYYANLYNWPDAKPLFLVADRGLRHGSPEQIHAHLGYLRATMETRSLPELSNYLAGLLRTPIMASNPQLRLWCLEVKGDVDGEMDSASARADWLEGHRVAKQLGDKKWESRSLAEAGFNAYLQGDIATARRNVAAALVTAHQTGDVGAEIRYLSAIGTGIEWNGGYKEAVIYFQKAFALAERHPETGYPFLTAAGEIETLIKERNFDEAQRLVQKASAIATQRQKLIKLTQLMLFDADIAIGQRQINRAIHILQKTIALAKHNQTSMLADAQMKLAEIYRKQRKLTLAEHYAATAFAHTSLTKDLFTAPARLEFTAQLQWDLGRRAQARRSIMRALEISEGLLAQTSSGGVREGLLTEMSSAYETAFKFAAQAGDVDGAFSVIERVRGRITAETLVQPAHFSDSDMNMALEDKIRNLKVQLIKADSTGERNRLIDALFYAEQRRFLHDKPAPTYASKIESVSLTRVTASLGSDGALLEYVLPKGGPSYCLFLSRQGTNIIRLRSAKEISALVHQFLDDIKTNKAWKPSARALYDAVLGAVPNVSRFGHLTIVPDGDLHLIHFDALVSPSGKLVGETTVTSYAPSAVSDFLLKTRPEPRAARAFLGVGGAIYNSAGMKPFLLAKAATRAAYLGINAAKLPNLPGSREEVQSAADILGATNENTTLQIGSGATEFAFTHAPLAKYQIIHLAIHAVADPSDPSRAALVFPPDSQHGSDGLLDPRDIANLHLRAEVVVLSACDTAVGRLQGQVGVANLSRAFLEAGADSVVSTLWPVNDVRSVYLMKAFYRNLANGRSAADALALAKRHVLHQSGPDTSPRLWAGFVLLGNGDAALQKSQAAAIRPPDRIQ